MTTYQRCEEGVAEFHKVSSGFRRRPRAPTADVVPMIPCVWGPSVVPSASRVVPAQTRRAGSVLRRFSGSAGLTAPVRHRFEPQEGLNQPETRSGPTHRRRRVVRIIILMCLSEFHPPCFCTDFISNQLISADTSVQLQHQQEVQ